MHHERIDDAFPERSAYLHDLRAVARPVLVLVPDPLLQPARRALSLEEPLLLDLSSFSRGPL